jgi:hypothetical protein
VVFQVNRTQGDIETDFELRPQPLTASTVRFYGVFRHRPADFYACLVYHPQCSDAATAPGRQDPAQRAWSAPELRKEDRY